MGRDSGGDTGNGHWFEPLEDGYKLEVLVGCGRRILDPDDKPLTPWWMMGEETAIILRLLKGQSAYVSR